MVPPGGNIIESPRRDSGCKANRKEQAESLGSLPVFFRFLSFSSILNFWYFPATFCTHAGIVL